MLQERTRAVRSRRNGLEQLRCDVRKAQQEALEMRLATEELWAQLCGVAPPAMLTQSISRLRLQIAQTYQLNIEELAAAKAELTTVEGRLADQQAKLLEHKQQLASWAEHRQKELAVQAQRLAAREKELSTRQAELEREEDDWQAERRQYQQQIRDLLRQLRSPVAT